MADDTISRQAALDALMDALTDVGALDAEDINTVFQMLPSAQSEPQWTPIKKGYPTESGYYNVTIMGYLDDRLEPAVEYYSPNTARDKKRWKAINVIAWRPADVYRE